MALEPGRGRLPSGVRLLALLLLLLLLGLLLALAGRLQVCPQLPLCLLCLLPCCGRLLLQRLLRLLRQLGLLLLPLLQAGQLFPLALCQGLQRAQLLRNAPRLRVRRRQLAARCVGAHGGGGCLRTRLLLPLPGGLQALLGRLTLPPRSSQLGGQLLCVPLCLLRLLCQRLQLSGQLLRSPLCLLRLLLRGSQLAAQPLCLLAGR